MWNSPCQRLKLSEESFRILIHNICMTGFLFAIILGLDSRQYQMWVCESQFYRLEYFFCNTSCSMFVWWYFFGDTLFQYIRSPIGSHCCHQVRWDVGQTILQLKGLQNRVTKFPLIFAITELNGELFSAISTTKFLALIMPQKLQIFSR